MKGKRLLVFIAVDTVLVLILVLFAWRFIFSGEEEIGSKPISAATVGTDNGRREIVDLRVDAAEDREVESEKAVGNGKSVVVDNKDYGNVGDEQEEKLEGENEDSEENTKDKIIQRIADMTPEEIERLGLTKFSDLIRHAAGKDSTDVDEDDTDLSPEDRGALFADKIEKLTKRMKAKEAKE
ncbi:MAG: hypothetical protein D6808_06780 [Candidatus Dadabacteria bacterium]|nr:MAG: hypothetical protein D6808_06780 [Candidatus Dadabacteria bacterium]